MHGEKGGYDAVVFVIDEDGDVTRRTQIDAAQASLEVSTLNRACGVAIQTFDAWMLADVAAWSELIGEAPEMSPDPESIRAPKDHCEELVRRLPTPTTRSAAYVDVASLCRIEVVERRCPKGFGEFATRVRALAR